MMLAALLLMFANTVINNCPTVEPGTCATTLPFEAHNVMVWHAGIDPWVCDGSVWWEASLDGSEPVVFSCSSALTEEGHTLVYCPDSVSPVKYWDRAPGQSAWLTVKACSAAGCSVGCEVELIWPDYTCYNLPCCNGVCP